MTPVRWLALWTVLVAQATAAGSVRAVACFVNRHQGRMAVAQSVPMVAVAGGASSG